MYVCICAAVSERQIDEAVRGGVRSVDQLSAELGVGAGCGCCRAMAAELIARAGSGSLEGREVSRLATPA